MTTLNSYQHKSKIENLDLSKGKFKNRIMVFIQNELKSSEKDLIKLTISSVDMVLNSIDLMNTTTHKLNVQKHYAEFCVISTITSVSLIKLIREISSTRMDDLHN